MVKNASELNTISMVPFPFPKSEFGQQFQRKLEARAVDTIGNYTK